MARTTITPVLLSPTAGTVASAATVATADGGSLAVSTRKMHKIVLHINNTAASAGTVIIAAGDEPPAFRAGLGSVAITVAGSTQAFAVIESARHVQSDGVVHIDLGTAVAIQFAAYLLPDTV